MTTPLLTVANSIIEFILSLLRDPAAVAELEENPEAALAKHKVAGICADDVRAVAPIIYDRPDVVPRSTPATPSQHNNDVLNEITRITNNWTAIDSRSTIVDQSVNQNIWTEGGDVTQDFDQTAGVASGDGSTAAGDDITAGPDADEETDEELPEGEEAPTDELPGIPDDALEGLEDAPAVPDDALDELEAGLGETSSDAGTADDATGATLPAEQPADAPPADVPQESAAVEDTAPAPDQPAPVYEPAASEVDESVWSEPTEAVPVDEIVYPDDLGEEQ